MTNRIESERLFLGCVLYENAVLASSKLTEVMFTKYRKVFAKIEELSAKGGVSVEDLFPLNDELGGWEIVLSVAEAIISSAHWQFHHDEIFKAWAEDTIKAAYRYAITMPYPECIEIVDRAVTAVALKQTSSRTKSVRELIGPAMERIVERSRRGGAIPGLEYGIQSVDEATLGAQDGQLIIIGARPSDGKSALAAQTMRHIAGTAKVGIFTVESDEMELMARVIASEARIDSRKVQTGKMSEIDMANLKEGIHRLQAKQDNMVIRDCPGIRLAQLQTAAREMVRDGVRIIFVDYLQLVRVPGAKDKREEVSTVSQGLKELARELKVPIVALAQLGRDADDKRPTLGDFQHSSQIEQDADQCWLIWHQRDKSGQITESRIIIAKARDGIRRDVAVKFDGPTLTFHEVVTDRRP